MDADSDRTGKTPPEETPGVVGDPLPSENTDTPGQPPRSGLPWQKIALAGAGLSAGAAGVVVATLAATHRTAVRENLAAYLNGVHDTLEAVRDGLDPFDGLDALDA